MKRIAFLWLVPVIALVISSCGSNEEPIGFKVEQDEISASKSAMQKTANDMMKKSEEAVSSVAASSGLSKSSTPKEFKPFPIYTDENSPDNHYFPSGWMGDFADLNFDSAYLKEYHSGSTSIRIKYNNNATQGARWAGVYWQNPANNWGNRPGGYDLTGAKKLVFWAKGEVGGERIEEFKVGGITGEYSDTDIAGIGPVILEQEWKEYVIDLDGKDLTSIIGGFAWSANLDQNPDGVTFYLDDMRFE